MNDLNELLRLERQLFSNPWPPQQFIREFSLEFSHIFIAESESTGDTAGYFILWICGDTAELHNIGVEKSMQNQGVGGSLLRFILEYSRGKAVEIYLEVRESNLNAIALYRKFGFQRFGVRKDYYSNPDEDALIYRKDLSEYTLADQK